MPGPHDRLPPGGAALVGPLAEGPSRPDHGRADVPGLDAGRASGRPRTGTTGARALGRRARVAGADISRGASRASAGPASAPAGGGRGVARHSARRSGRAQRRRLVPVWARAGPPAGSAARRRRARSASTASRSRSGWRSSARRSSTLELAVDRPWRLRRRAALRRRARRRLDAHHLRRAEPHPSRRPRASGRRSSRARYRGARPAQRRRARLPAGPPHPPRPLDHLLADRLAVARAGDADHLHRRQRARPAGARAGSRGRRAARPLPPEATAPRSR